MSLSNDRWNLVFKFIKKYPSSLWKVDVCEFIEKMLLVLLIKYRHKIDSKLVSADVATFLHFFKIKVFKYDE